MKRWLWRVASSLALILAIGGIIFWTGLTAPEPAVVLPTFQATAVAVESGPAANLQPNSATPLFTLTPIPTLTLTPQPGVNPTQRSSSASASARPSPTPTSRPQPTTGISAFEPDFPTQVPAATPVEQLDIPAGITNVLLLGIDAINPGEQSGSERTDAIIIVSVNREEGTASMLSLPRDLYLYIPGWQNARINSAYARGTSVAYPGGGVQLLKDTVLYNFGIPIHYYAKIDFEGLQDIVDSVGGIEIINSCTLQDWRLKEPGLDIELEENYVMYTLEPGVHQMDGFSALWYARSRRTTSDFDRGRRQQQILNALFQKGVDLNLLPQIPRLWDAFQNTVDTDMDIGKMLQLAAVAPAIQENGIQHLYLTQGELESITIPESGAQVQMLNSENAQKTFARLYDVPALHRSAKDPIYIEIINNSGNGDMAEIAADNARWFGFRPVITVGNGPVTRQTSLRYHRQNLKGSYDWLVSWIFGLTPGDINLAPNVETPYQYTVVLDQDYSTCRNPLYAPRP